MYQTQQKPLDKCIGAEERIESLGNNMNIPFGVQNHPFSE
jgi:hypothetical protein